MQYYTKVKQNEERFFNFPPQKQVETKYVMTESFVSVMRMSRVLAVQRLSMIVCFSGL